MCRRGRAGEREREREASRHTRTQYVQSRPERFVFLGHRWCVVLLHISGKRGFPGGTPLVYGVLSIADAETHSSFVMRPLQISVESLSGLTKSLNTETPRTGSCGAALKRERPKGSRRPPTLILTMDLLSRPSLELNTPTIPLLPRPVKVVYQKRGSERATSNFNRTFRTARFRSGEASGGRAAR